ncbi:MAG: hypothetical protein M0022_08325 [Desulfobacteraceae bacterium]|nr:hypothetical protein [Desulfobacteraceae bacterium]
MNFYLASLLHCEMWRFFKTEKAIKFKKPYKLRGASRIHIGENFHAGSNLWLEAVTCYGGQDFDPIIKILDNVSLSTHVHIACTNRIEIGNNVLMGSYVLITDHNHGYYDSLHSTRHESPYIPPARRMLTEDGHITIGDNVWIGSMVSILPNTTIGNGSIIGCNSVVKGDIPSYSIAVGNPAKVIKKYSFDKEIWVDIADLK